MARAPKPVDLEALALRAEALVSAHGAVPRGEMKTFRPHLAALEPRLASRGIEVGSTIRRPLAAQLEALAREGFVPVKGLERRVSGATAREVKATADALVASRALLRVVRESGLGFVASEASILEREAVADLTRRLTRLQKLMKTASSKKQALLVSDVEALLGAWSAPQTSIPPTDAVVERILDRVRQSELPTRVPELLRSLGVPFDAAKRALVDGATRGLFDLEPESGMGRLSREDAELCPDGPMGTRLSWVRVRVGVGARGARGAAS